MINIKSLLTALGNPKQYNQLKNIKNIKLVAFDIQYKEGVLEYLDESIDVNYLLLNENLIGEISTYELLKKIRNKNNRIKVILITDKENIHIKVYKRIKEFNVQIIINILDGKTIYNSRMIQQVVKKKKNEGKIITIVGSNGIGKSTFAVALANSLNTKKVLLIDFDFRNNSLGIILNVRNKNNKIIKTGNIEVFPQRNFLSSIIHTKHNINLIQSKNIFNQDMNENPGQIAEKVQLIKDEYDFIIIDTSIIEFPEYIKSLAQISNNVIVISGANLLEIRKTNQILNMCKTKWCLKEKKIKIVINKYTKLSIDEDVLKIIFKKYQVVGMINASESYDLAINKNNMELEEIQKQIIKISDKIGGKHGISKQSANRSNTGVARVIKVSK